MYKTAKNSEEAWDLQDMKKGFPHGWIQWKGTDVCMDVYCACGVHSHVDAEFAYHVKCPACGKVYFCNGHIELIALEEEPADCVVEGEAPSSSGRFYFIMAWRDGEQRIVEAKDLISAASRNFRGYPVSYVQLSPYCSGGKPRTFVLAVPESNYNTVPAYTEVDGSGQ